ncbi:MAG: ABC transporter substrate-binding protein [Actinomycetota bacterium]
MSMNGCRKSKSRRGRVGLAVLFAVAMLAACEPPTTPSGGGGGAGGDALRIGIVSFLTGPAAEPFGIPARDAANLLADRLNAGSVPEPLDEAGFGGQQLELVVVDETGDPESEVSQYRRLVLDEEVDIVVGYISSADCLAVAPVAEELQKLTVLFDCGTHQIFEESDHKYVFRTAGHQILDSVGAARYVNEIAPGAQTIAGINQNYAWGQDSWNAFKASMQELNSSVETGSAQFPEIFSGEYSAEISSLLSDKPDVIHSSFWGGDLEGLIIQGVPRGLQDESLLVLTTADTLLPRLGAELPPGIVVGARGPHGALAPDAELNEWFTSIYTERYGIRPVYPAYHMAQAFFGAKTAYELAMEQNGGGEPSQDQIIAAFEGIEFETPSGTISMALGGGHQAIEEVAYGTTGEFDEETGEVAIENIQTFPAGCVNPPDGTKSMQWIQSGFEGTEC